MYSRKTQASIVFSINPNKLMDKHPFLYIEDSKVKNYDKIYSKL